MYFTGWFNVVHAFEGKVPFSQLVPVQALLWSCQMLRLECQGQHILNVHIYVYTPKQNRSALYSAHQLRKYVTSILAPQEHSLCHGFSFNLNSASHRLGSSACSSATDHQDQCRNVMQKGGVALLAQHYPSWTGKWKNKAEHVKKLKNQSTVIRYFCHGKCSNYSHYRGKAGDKRRVTILGIVNRGYRYITVWRYAFATKKENMFDENGLNTVSITHMGWNVKPPWAFTWHWSRLFSRVLKLLDPLLPLSPCAKLQCEVVQPGLEPKALEFSKRIFSRVLQS